ncbi:MAG TPA: hypothetical protein VJU81_25340 [Methylomirabilota bacterium]|nr:hypothetical protein [Methylomirabilota bacterium]
MGEGTTRLSTVPRGTVRAVDTGDANGRLRALADDITTVRERLHALVDELDRRRHAALDLRGHARRHVREIALSALALAAVAGVVVAYRAGWLDRSRLGRRRAGWLSASSTRRRSRRG